MLRRMKGLLPLLLVLALMFGSVPQTAQAATASKGAQKIQLQFTGTGCSGVIFTDVSVTGTNQNGGGATYIGSPNSATVIPAYYTSGMLVGYYWWQNSVSIRYSTLDRNNYRQYRDFGTSAVVPYKEGGATYNVTVACRK